MDTPQINELQQAIAEIAFFGPTTAGEKRLSKAIWASRQRQWTVDELWQLYQIYAYGYDQEPHDVNKHTQ